MLKVVYLGPTAVDHSLFRVNENVLSCSLLFRLLCKGCSGQGSDQCFGDFPLPPLCEIISILSNDSFLEYLVI